MARVVFKLNSGQDGTIQLRDCEFVEAWKDVFKKNKLVGMRDTVCYYAKHYNYVAETQKLKTADSQRREAELINTIEDGISGVRNTGMPWSRTMPYHGMGWATTNDIHRGFTTLEITRCTDRVNLTREDKQRFILNQTNFNTSEGQVALMSCGDGNYKPVSQGKQFADATSCINSGVHLIEDQCRVSKRQTLVSCFVLPGHSSCLPKLDWDSKAEDNITDAIKVNYDLGDTAKWAVDNNPYWNVYDLKNILGKDYLTAYFNYDDPGEWDVCNHFRTTKGGFEILPHMHHVVNNILVPWIADDWGYRVFPEVVSPIQIGHIDEGELFNISTPTKANGYDISRNQIAEVDLID